PRSGDEAIPRIVPRRFTSRLRGLLRQSLRSFLAMTLLMALSQISFAQTRDSLVKKDTVKITKEPLKRDTVFKHEDIAHQGHDTVIHKKDSIYRRALAEFDASSITITNEAVRAYSSPMTFSALLEQMNGAYALLQTDQGYGRESFLFTNR